VTRRIHKMAVTGAVAPHCSTSENPLAQLARPRKRGRSPARRGLACSGHPPRIPDRLEIIHGMVRGNNFASLPANADTVSAYLASCADGGPESRSGGGGAGDRIPVGRKTFLIPVDVEAYLTVH